MEIAVEQSWGAGKREREKERVREKNEREREEKRIGGQGIEGE